MLQSGTALHLPGSSPDSGRLWESLEAHPCQPGPGPELEPKPEPEPEPEPKPEPEPGPEP